MKLGETQTINDVSMTRVGRWMSPDEMAQMQSSNKIVQGGGGQTLISTNGAADLRGASKGSVYVEFEVPSSGLLQGGKNKKRDGPLNLPVPVLAVIQAMELRRFPPTAINGDGPLISTILRKIVAPCDSVVISL